MMIDVMFSPGHVFRSFGRFVKGKFIIFPTPAQSILQMAALVATLHFGARIRFSETTAGIYILILALTSPVWSYLIFRFVGFLLSIPLIVPGGGIPSAAPLILITLLDDLLGWFWVPQAIAVMRRPKAFGTLDWKKYTQASMLCAVYACIAIPLALVPAGAVFGVIRLVGVPIFGVRDITGDQLAWQAQCELVIVLAILAAYGLAWMILRPWAYLLLYCSRYPDTATLQYETLALRQSFDNLFFRDGIDIRGATTSSAVLDLKREFRILLARWRMAERAALRDSEERLNNLLLQRRPVAVDLTRYRLYLDDKRDLDIIESLDRIGAGRPIGNASVRGGAASCDG
jgi:hypothetical protein